MPTTEKPLVRHCVLAILGDIPKERLDAILDKRPFRRQPTYDTILTGEMVDNIADVLDDASLVKMRKEVTSHRQHQEAMTKTLLKGKGIKKKKRQALQSCNLWH